MQSLLLDELGPEQVATLRGLLATRCQPSLWPDIFWLELPTETLGAEQTSHLRDCGPFRFSLALEEKALRLELLVRAAGTLHCTCLAMATPAQRGLALNFWDQLMHDLNAATAVARKPGNGQKQL